MGYLAVNKNESARQTLSGSNYIFEAGTKKLCLRTGDGPNDIIKYPLTTNTSASQYSPLKLKVDNRDAYIAMQSTSSSFTSGSTTQKVETLSRSESSKYTSSWQWTETYTTTDETAYRSITSSVQSSSIASTAYRTSTKPPLWYLGSYPFKFTHTDAALLHTETATRTVSISASGPKALSSNITKELTDYIRIHLNAKVVEKIDTMIGHTWTSAATGHWDGYRILINTTKASTYQSTNSSYQTYTGSRITVYGYSTASRTTLTRTTSGSLGTYRATGTMTMTETDGRRYTRNITHVTGTSVDTTFTASRTSQVNYSVATTYVTNYSSKTRTYTSSEYQYTTYGSTSYTNYSSSEKTISTSSSTSTLFNNANI